MEQSGTCIFNGCAQPVMNDTNKCSFHSHRSLCRMKHCKNQVYARYLCVRHGGKRSCQVEGCKMKCRVGKFCVHHGPTTVRLCTEPECTKQAHARGKCVRHGGGRLCKIIECQSHARVGAFCGRHKFTLQEAKYDENVLDAEILSVLLNVVDEPWLSAHDPIQAVGSYMNQIHLS